MMRIFPTVPPRTDETPASLISRLAVRHNAPSVGSFALDMGAPFQAIVDGKPEAVQLVAELVGCPVEPLQNATITKIGSGFNHRGQKMQKASLRRARVLVCPRCIAEDLAYEASPWMASGRVHWLLDPIRACRHHGVMLVEIGHEEPPAPLHDFARCVAPSLVKIPRLAAEAQEVRLSPIERYLIDRLEGQQDHTWLGALPWYTAARTCEMIGAVEVFGRKASIKALTDHQWREAGAAGYEIASGGHLGIRAFLERMRSTYPESYSDGSGPQAWFGRLHTWLAGMDEEDYDPLRAVLIDFVRETAPVGPDDQMYGRQIVEKRRLHSIRTAALETGLHPKRLRRLLAASGTISPDHRELTDDRVLFSAAQAEEFLLKAKHAISERDAQDYLNAGRVHTRLLAQAELITPFVSSGQEVLKVYAYDTRELDEFLVALSAKAQVTAGHADPIYRIPEAAKRANCSAVEIVRAILDGKLDWVGQIIGETGYMAMLVNVMEVRRLVRGGHGDMLTLTVVQASLRTTFGVVDALVRSGILPSETAVSPINRCPYTAVRAADLKTFQTTFGSLQEIARERGTHFAPLKKALMKHGIEPCFGKPAVPATFYRRAEIPQNL